MSLLATVRVAFFVVASTSHAHCVVSAIGPPYRSIVVHADGLRRPTGLHPWILSGVCADSDRGASSEVQLNTTLGWRFLENTKPRRHLSDCGAWHGSGPGRS